MVVLVLVLVDVVGETDDSRAVMEAADISCI